MIIILSPSKTIQSDFQSPDFIQPNKILFPKETNQILGILRQMRLEELKNLMKINSDLALLNYERFQEWKFPFNDNSKPALWSFKGEVYHGLDAANFNQEDYIFIKDKLKILSGFYGMLRPDDFILPYRLEMGTSLKIGNSKNLYDFWSEKITKLLIQDLKKSENVLVNLASNEYFKVLKTKNIKAKIITPEFYDSFNGGYKILPVYAKKARGLMVQFITKNKITNPEDMKFFDWSGYYFSDKRSNDNNFVFTRG